VSQSSKLLLALVAAIAATAAFWFLALTPKREEAAKLDTDIAAKQAQFDQSVAQLAGYEKAKRNYKVNYTTMTRLGKAVPGDDDVRSLLVQINDAAARSNVEFQAINVGGGSSTTPDATGGAAPGTKAPPPGTVRVGSAGFSAMPFSFSFEGSYFQLSDFFDRLEDFVTVTNKDVEVTGRLLLLGSISLTADQGDLRHLKAQIGAASYLAPTADTVQAAAPPGASGPGATPPASGTPNPPTSATITGVR
jgi:Tfp pilus assembly protein PilO